MTPILILVSGLLVVGGVAAVAANTPRAAVLGLLLALAGAAYVVEPVPGPLALGVRLAGTTLGAYLVWIALRRAPGALPASSAGWAGSVVIAVAGFAAGFLAAGTLGVALAGGSPEGPGTGGIAAALIEGSLVPRAALGAAFALVALGLPQVVLARDTLRLGVGLMLLLAATGLASNALYGLPDPVEDLSLAVLTAIAGAGTAALVAASIRRGGELVIRDSLRPDAPIRHRAADEAHRTGAP
jgi:hypothetical protein